MTKGKAPCRLGRQVTLQDLPVNIKCDVFSMLASQVELGFRRCIMNGPVRLSLEYNYVQRVSFVAQAEFRLLVVETPGREGPER